MKSESTKDILTAGVRDPIPSATSCSHLILKACKLRIYPNKEQRELLDYNAALNIRDEGTRILSGGGSPSDVKQKRGKAAA